MEKGRKKTNVGVLNPKTYQSIETRMKEQTIDI